MPGHRGQKRKSQMSGEVESLSRRPTLDGQTAQKTVGQAVAFSPQRGGGTHTVHGSIGKCPRKGQGRHRRGQREGHTWEGDSTTTKLLAVTMFNTVPSKNEFNKGDNLRSEQGRVK